MDDVSIPSIPAIINKRKYATPIRVLLAGIVIVHFFHIYTLPDQVLHVAGALIALNLISIAIEKLKMSTVEVKERKCPKCNIPMYSKIIKCQKCGIQLDTDDAQQ